LAVGAIGAVMFARVPTNRVAMLFVTVGPLVGLALVCTFWPPTVLGHGPDDRAVTAALLGSVLIQCGITGLAPPTLALFPDGRIADRVGRAAVWLAVVAAIWRATELVLVRPELLLLPGVANPYARFDLEAGTAWAVQAAGILLAGVALLLAAMSTVRRYRRAAGMERHQVLWYAWAGILCSIAAAPLLVTWIVTDPSDTAYGDLVGSIFLLSLVLLPAAAAVGILRYRLYEIDRVVNRTLVYGALTAILAGLAAALITLTQRMFLSLTGETSDVAVVLVALVATAAYTPVRRRLEVIVDRRVRWTSSLEPWRHELERALEVVEPDAAARRLLREASIALDPTWAEVRVRSGRGWRVVEAHGSVQEAEAERIPVRRGDRAVAELRLGPAADADGFPSERLEELRRVADLLGRTVRDPDEPA
jgi:hypothetical protein